MLYSFQDKCTPFFPWLIYPDLKGHVFAVQDSMICLVAVIGFHRPSSSTHKTQHLIWRKRIWCHSLVISKNTHTKKSSITSVQDGLHIWLFIRHHLVLKRLDGDHLESSDSGLVWEGQRGLKHLSSRHRGDKGDALLSASSRTQREHPGEKRKKKKRRIFSYIHNIPLTSNCTFHLDRCLFSPIETRDVGYHWFSDRYKVWIRNAASLLPSKNVPGLLIFAALKEEEEDSDLLEVGVALEEAGTRHTQHAAYGMREGVRKGHAGALLPIQGQFVFVLNLKGEAAGKGQVIRYTWRVHPAIR